MKKSFMFAVTLFAAVALVFTACGADDTTEVKPPIDPSEIFHTVSFDTAGGTVGGSSTIAPIFVKHGDSLGGRFPLPVRDGFKFDGWFDGETQYNSTKPIEKDLTLTAKWEAIPTDGSKVLIIFDTAGANSVVYPLLLDSGASLGTAFPTATFERAGHRFSHWYIADGSGHAADSTTTFAANTTIRIRWIEQITIKFHFEGGTISVDVDGTATVIDGDESTHSIVIDKGSSMGGNYPTASAKNTALQFAGWFLDGDDDFEVEITQDIVLNDDRDLYAHFAAADGTKWVVEFHGGTGVTNVPGPVLVDKEAPGNTMGTAFPAAIPVRGVADYFVGWFDATTGGTQYTAATAITKDTVLHPQWQTMILISFNTDGGFPATIDGKYVRANTAIGAEFLPGDPSKSGHRFDGWYVGGGALTVTVTDATTFASAGTIQAKWVATVRIVFHLGGGFFMSGSDEVTIIAPVTIDSGSVLATLPPVLDHKNDRLSWDGWYVGTGSTAVALTATTPFSVNTDIYAHFTPMNDYIITFDAKTGNGADDPGNITIALDATDKTMGDQFPDDPERVGFTFGGWFDNEAFTGDAYTATTEITKDTDLFAKWLNNDATMTAIAFTVGTVNGNVTTIGTPAATAADAIAGEMLIPIFLADQTTSGVTFTAANTTNAVIRYAFATGTTAPTFGTSNVITFDTAVNAFLYVEVVSQSGTATNIYKIRVNFNQRMDIKWGSPTIANGTVDTLWNDPELAEYPIEKVFANDSNAAFIASPDTYGLAKAMWDDDGLYVFVRVADPDVSIAAHTGNFHLYDSLELFINERVDALGNVVKDPVTYAGKGGQYRLSAGGVRSGDPGDATTAFTTLGKTSAWTITGTDPLALGGNPGYVLVLQAPWRFSGSATGADTGGNAPWQAVNDKMIGFEMQLNATSAAGGTGARRGVVVWNNIGNGNYQNVSNYGEAKLVGRPTTGTTVVTFDANGGTTVSHSTITIKTGNVLPFMPANPTRASHTFNGFTLTKDGDDMVTLTTTFASNTTVYAKWTYVPSITLDPKGGTVSSTSILLNANGTPASLPTPTLGGNSNRFGGWFQDEAFTQRVHLNTVLTSGSTIYARWGDQIANVDAGLTGNRIFIDRTGMDIAYGHSIGELVEANRFTNVGAAVLATNVSTGIATITNATDGGGGRSIEIFAANAIPWDPAFFYTLRVTGRTNLTAQKGSGRIELTRRGGGNMVTGVLNNVAAGTYDLTIVLSQLNFTEGLMMYANSWGGDAYAADFRFSIDDLVVSRQPVTGSFEVDLTRRFTTTHTSGNTAITNITSQYATAFRTPPTVTNVTGGISAAFTDATNTNQALCFALTTDQIALLRGGTANSFRVVIDMDNQSIPGSGAWDDPIVFRMLIGNPRVNASAGYNATLLYDAVSINTRAILRDQALRKNTATNAQNDLANSAFILQKTGAGSAGNVVIRSITIYY